MIPKFNKYRPEAGPPAHTRDQVERLSLALGNAIIAREDEYKIQSAREDLLEFLDEAIGEYGESVYLLATKGDFLTEAQDRVDAYKKALELAEVIGDVDNFFMVGTDLLTIYADEMRDKEFVELFRRIEQFAHMYGQLGNEEYLTLRREHHDVSNF